MATNLEAATPHHRCGCHVPYAIHMDPCVDLKMESVESMVEARASSPCARGKRDSAIPASLSPRCLLGCTPRNLSSCTFIDDSLILYPCGCTLVVCDTQGRQLVHMLGHTSPVKAVAASPAARVVVSGQEGRFPTIRVWCMESYSCLAILGGLAFLTSLHVNDGGAAGTRLVAGGTDTNGRSEVLMWDISEVKHGKHPLLARQVSDAHIARVIFSPFDPSRLVTVGRENIRFWRTKGKTIPSCPVALNDHSRASTFTDVCFESSYGASQGDGGDRIARHVFVSSKEGTVLQINYDTRTLDCVFRLHDGAINCIAINEGFCVTGGEDSFLRVWPLDFSDFFLEAQHDGAITCLSIRANGLQISVGTSTGSVGILDVSSHSYTTLVRSHDHRGATGVSLSHCLPEACTVGPDKTIRVWHSESCEQLFQFDAPGDTPVSVAFHPRDHVLACGFISGTVRIFDVDSASVIHTLNQHRASVTHVKYSPDGFLLFSCSLDSNLCVYNTLDNYLPLKMTPTTEQPSNPTLGMVMAPNGEFIVCVSKDGACLFSAQNLNLIGRIQHCHSFTGAAAVSRDSDFVFIATYDSNTVCKFSTRTCALTTEFPTKERVNALAASPSKNLLVLGTAGSTFKVWDLTCAPMQVESFLGHPRGVSAFEFSRDGQTLISIGPSQDVIIWNSEVQATLLLADG